jgi:hypothetical protein
MNSFSPLFYLLSCEFFSGRLSIDFPNSVRCIFPVPSPFPIARPSRHRGLALPPRLGEAEASGASEATSLSWAVGVGRKKVA